MFTGIITEIGKIVGIAKTDKAITFTVQTKNILENKDIGESIAVNGACMTITFIDKGKFNFEAINETLEKTNLKNLQENSLVNLEPAVPANQALNGHIVQGHIDSIGTIKELVNNEDKTRITINFPKEIEKLLAYKGSITVNGVSLTISDLQINNFSVDITPHTFKKTNLGKLKKEDKVNIEVDIIARYIERMLGEKEEETKFQFLKERGFI